MNDLLPEDPDGQALRRIAENGSDFSRPMFVDFQVAVPSEQSAIELASAARKLGYHTKIYGSPKCTMPWTCECSTRMVVTYEGVIAVQKELALIAAPFGGVPDGWGTFGNGPSGQPAVV